ncbi:DUF1638 domain-containing protein [Aestuariispira insulae]|uniref:Uncharacterized protein DUF1638 n=1 Tax=Aestuariispira insulae TaxID=1461337 RepID=A0A3D9HRX3_9PROT|nr:DUF1638 domain-containing protein [Aestuariispira insulae]RED52263.1 uncharacterized protein DUF1638 [Aestuariispira insulae]
MTAGLQEFEDPGTSESPEFLPETAKTLVIACGALAREILDVIKLNGWQNLAITCLPAKLHNAPDQITPRLREKIRANKDRYTRILVAYADCGTGGLIDKMIEEEGVERIGGPHCYSFYAGQQDFDALAEQELGTFYLTDYMVRHFDSLIMEGMGLNKYPQMRELMFGNYKRLVYLAQMEDPKLDDLAEQAAEKLQLSYRKVFTGYGELATFMAAAAK